MASILIAEDDPTNQRFLRHVLQQAGHCVFISPHGRHAWEALCAENHFDLLIADIMMPGMDGTTLIRTLRADDRFAALPIIVMSAFLGAGDISTRLGIGSTLFLAKPSEISDVVDVVAKALG
jgi:CheY-like chemotaxis protein